MFLPCKTTQKKATAPANPTPTGAPTEYPTMTSAAGPAARYAGFADLAD